MKLSRSSSYLSSLFLLFGMGACTTTHSSNVIQLGESGFVVKKNAFAELETSDWAKVSQATQCLTHLYRCTIDDKGLVTAVEPIDRSNDDFKEFSEEALRSWEFEKGKPGHCFVDFVYTRRMKPKTTILLLNEKMARDMASVRAKNRQFIAQFDHYTRSFASAISGPLPSMPKEAALKGLAGTVAIELDVDDEGRVINPKILYSMPKRIFDESTLKTVKTWRYASLAAEPNSVRKGNLVTVNHYLPDVPTSGCDMGTELLEKYTPEVAR